MDEDPEVARFARALRAVADDIRRRPDLVLHELSVEAVLDLGSAVSEALSGVVEPGDALVLTGEA